MNTSNTNYEISVEDSNNNINISNGDLAFTIHCNKDYDSFSVIVFKINNELILEVGLNEENKEYNIYYSAYGITGVAKDPVDYINKALQSYPDLVDLLGECQSGSEDLLTFSNLQKLANIE